MSDLLTVHTGDAISVLGSMPDESAQCCVTSPPYWGLRDYGHGDQIGLENTPELFLAKMLDVFRGVRRVLKQNGTIWVNMGDGYNAAGKCIHLKSKDMIGMPWRLAFALQADGWYLRSDIIWSKPNPMPESVIDRPTKAHEYIFLLSKSERYYYDAEAIREESTWNPDKSKMPDGWDTGDGAHGSFHRNGREKGRRTDKQRGHSRRHNGFNDRWDSMSKDEQASMGRNKRTVWTVPTYAYPEAHFATYPPDLIKPCILAGTKPGDVVLDPFGGSGTTGQVAIELGRKAVLIELNPSYVELIHQRCNITPGLAL